MYFILLYSLYQFKRVWQEIFASNGNLIKATEISNGYNIE